MKVEYINKPVLPVTILVIGAGGNGSQMISQLARINHALRGLGKPGLQVWLMDDDLVSPSNVGRQMFSISEIGQPKANILISRINRFYGLTWQSIPAKFTDFSSSFPATNLIITCTDNVASRMAVQSHVKGVSKAKGGDHEYKFHYWLDLGNTKDVGQVILGSPRHKLPTVVDENPDIEKMEAADDTPSCSIAEALAKQDLFINTFITDVAAKLLWEMFIAEKDINWRGAYINCRNLKIGRIAA